MYNPNSKIENTETPSTRLQNKSTLRLRKPGTMLRKDSIFPGKDGRSSSVKLRGNKENC